MADSAPDFAAMPLDRQLQHLEAGLEQREDPRELLARCARVRDHAPLAWLVRRLLEQGWLADRDHRQFMATFLLERSETAVDRVLKSLVGDGTWPERCGAALRDALLAVLERVPLSRVSVMCLVDRALKHNFAEARDAYVEALTERCAEYLRQGQADAVTVDLLAQVSADGVDRLRREADAHGAATAEALEASLRRLADGVLEVLGQAPKAISQANAEELLSKRVYTDPGHFLVELLQNAEDSGARCFKLRFEPTRIVLWHDGKPFDTRDVVGVTSIGQTTKRKQQIGFFGVGFKSVYEVTDRPQIYSDVYRFEIADVSIPKALSTRPGDVPADGTVLVLPLRNPADAERSPAMLYAKARDLDAIVLFTLRRIDVIELELVGPGGSVTRHAVHELPPDARGISKIRQEPEGWIRGYAVHDAEYVYVGGWRAPGKADRTRVMVGLRVDEHGVPRALEEDTPTVYSYLPTEEHSGLRFFVQGHFDVPVDRERITQDSRWNEWILGKVAPGLALLGQRLTEGLPREQQARAAEGLLCALPLPQELGSPIFRRITGGLRAAFARLPVVPCEDGSLQVPRASLVADPQLAALFEGAPVRFDEEHRQFCHHQLDPRAVEVARTLGAGRYEVADLVEGLADDLADVEDGAVATEAGAPVFVREPTAARMAAVYEALELALLRRTTKGPRHVDLQVLRRLKSLPLVLSGEHTLYRPEAPIVRADPALRSIYAGLRRFVHPDLDDAVDPEDPGRASTTSLLERLGVRTLGERDLVVDLEAQLGAHQGPLPGLGATASPGTPERLRAVLTLLADAPVPLRRRALKLPIIRARDGRYYRAARAPGDLGGVLMHEPGPVADRLAEYYGTSRPIAALAEDDPALALLRQARTPALSVEALVAELRERPAAVSDEELGRLHALLESIRDELPERMRRELARLPIWPDTAGIRRPLRGEGAVRLPASPAIAALFPGVPFLRDDVLRRSHARDMGGEIIELETVIVALHPEADPTLRIEPTAATVAAVIDVLRAERDAIHPRLRARLAQTPAFLSDAGEPCRLDALSLAESPTLRGLYGDWPRRKFVDPASPTRAAIEELELDGKLERADAETLVADLAGLTRALDGRRLGEGELPLVLDATHLARLLGYCGEQAASLPRTAVLRLARTALFPDQEGRLGPLGDASGPPRETDVHACAAELRPVFEAIGTRVLAAWAHEACEALVEAASREPLGVLALVEQLEGLTPVDPGGARAPAQSRACLAAIQEALVEQASTLAHRFPPVPRVDLPPTSPALTRLAIWPTRAGGVIAAEHAVDSEALLAMVPAMTPARERLKAVTVEEQAVGRLRRLAPLVVPASTPAFAAVLLQAEARPDRPLREQSPMLGSLEAVGAWANFIGTGPLPPPVELALPAPLVDAAGRLRLGSLRRADEETVTLVQGTALAGELLHPDLVTLIPGVEELPAMEPSAVLMALAAGHTGPMPLAEHPVLNEPTRRERLHAWISSHESEIFTDAEARDLLRGLPLWPTDRGTLRPADQLVIDPDLPPLDVDWTPHPELPADTLALLKRHLGIGRPPVEDLVTDHLAPAYHRAAAQGDGPGAASLLRYVARALASASTQEVRALLGAEQSVQVEGAHERFVGASSLILPPPELARAVEAVFGARHPPPHPRLPPEVHPLLAQLGVPRLPPLDWLAEAMRSGVSSPHNAAGLALLVGHRYREDPQATLAALPLQEVAWVLDGHGVARRPGELFSWTTEVQALVGDSPGLYAAPEVARALGEGLGEVLGFRSHRDVRLEEVVEHIAASSRRGTPLPFLVYRWLERGLAEGWLDGSELRRRLEPLAWVCTDDGEYHRHARVLGTRALEYFGSRRGYWERGRQDCPTLCRAFGIPTAVSPAVLGAFVEEVAADAEARGDAALLEAEPGLPRMLLRAYAALGREAEPFPARRVLCRAHGGHEGGALRLRPPEDPLVLRSDAPTLEAMFAAAGRFFVAAPGPVDDRAAIDAYYESCGIRRLRDAYVVEVADAGEDLTGPWAEEVAGLRVGLRGLLACLPRVKLQRTHLAAEAWAHRERLAPLARTGPIRARAGLEVAYVLPGVGQARTRAMAVYDPARATLLVDVRVLDDPAGTVTGLAQGVMPCIYDGPGEEQLLDIVEILLRLGTRERMDAYLDTRFFPTATEIDQGLAGRLATRVGELFDYGLDRRLCARFAELRGCDLQRWRDPGLYHELPEDEERAVQIMVARLLGTIDRSEASQTLSDALALLLSAASLSDVPAGLLAPEAAPEPSGEAEVPRPRVPAAATEFEQDSSPLEPDELPSLAELDAQLAELTARSGRAHDEDVTVLPHDGPAAGAASGDLIVDPSWLDLPGDVAETLDDTEAPVGFWRRLARSFGFAEEDDGPPPESLPAWAQPGANVLGPAPFVGPQLWVRGNRLREMATQRIPAGLLHHPRTIPAPHRYAIHTLGGRFEATTQRWYPIPALELPGMFDGLPSGSAVSFAGALAPGRCLLPVPLYGDVTRLEVVDGDPAQVRAVGRLPGGGAVLEVDGEASVRIHYEVALRRTPTLTEAHAQASAVLRQPTLARETLPATVQRWLERTASTPSSAWEQARRVEAFVQAHYVYDLEFRERPEVERAARSLRAHHGNHHLSLLHASSDRQVLGRGVCYELNVLVVELLRQLGVPALVATGWLLNEGFADRPDHLFALALVPSTAGPCLLPLDASTSARGPVRPLAGSAPPAVDIAPLPRPTIPEPGGGWSTPVLPGPDVSAEDEHLHAAQRALRAAVAQEREALRRVINVADAARGGRSDPPPPDAELDALRRRAAEALGDPARLAPMLAVIRGDYDHTPIVPTSVQELIRDGLATVQTYPSYRVRPADERRS